MRSGVGYPSYAPEAVYALVTGSQDANYPIQNLSDLTHIRTPFATTATAAIAFTFTLPVARVIQLLSLVHCAGTTDAHTGAPTGDTIRWRLFSDNNPDPTGNPTHIVSDSGVVPLLPGGAAPYAAYPQMSPYILGAPTTVRSGRIDLSASTGPWAIGGLEIAGWWEWTDVGVPREIGFDNRDIVTQGAFDVDYTTSVVGLRVTKGQRAVMDQSEARSTAADFLYDRGFDKPFVYCWDIGDVSVYPRECVLMRNNTITPPTMNDYPAAQFDYDFLEHYR